MIRVLHLAAACLVTAAVLSACAVPPSAGVQKALASPAGQLFCSFQLAGGGSFVAGLVKTAASNAAPGAAPLFVLATDAGEAAVNRDCDQAANNVAGAVSGVPVSPPAAPDSVAQVAIAAPASPVSAGPPPS